MSDKFVANRTGCMIEIVAIVIIILGFIRIGNDPTGGWIFLIAGALLFIYGFTKARPPKCPYCKGVIERKATVCKNCGRDLPNKAKKEIEPEGENK